MTVNDVSSPPLNATTTFFFFSSIAVSYTHLDVYKRQVVDEDIGSGNPLSVEFAPYRFSPAGIGNGEVKTVLDVYKRQV